MTDTVRTGKRPGIVTLIVVYLWVVAIAAALVGIVLVIGQASDDVIAETGRTSSELLTMGIVELVIAVLVAAAALALGSGSRTARSFVAAVMVIRISATVFIVALNHTTGYLLAGLVHVVLPFFVLWALYGNDQTEAYFGDL